MKNQNVTRRSLLQGAATATVASMMGSAFANKGKFNYYNWGDYIQKNALPDFAKEFNYEVTESNFASLDEMFAKLSRGNVGYDMVVPDQDWIPRMVRADMLEELDLSQIPNIKNLKEEWRGLGFDPANKYHVPYLWGTLGIGHSKSATEGTELSVKHIFESDKFADDGIGWMNSASVMFNFAKAYLNNGILPQKPDPQLVKEATALMKKQKKHVRLIHDEPSAAVIGGDVVVAPCWNGLMTRGMAEDDDIGYAITTDGCYRWLSCMCIPKGAPHIKEAHDFINYMMRPQVGADLANFAQYATPNKAAFELTPAEYRNAKSTFPDPKIVAKLPFPVYLGEEYARQINDAWNEIKAM